MEDDEDNNMAPPFWLQTSDTHSHRLRRRRSLSSVFLNSGLLLALLLVIACVFIFFIVPSFLSFTSQIFRPNSIKKSWDSLNLVLVLFAIVCGFLSRNNTGSSSNGNYEQGAAARSNYYEDGNFSSGSVAKSSYPLTPRRFYDYQQQDRVGFGTGHVNGGLSRLRSFSSYPDLRQESLWVGGDDRWRFYDDTHLREYRFSTSDEVLRGDDVPSRRNEEENGGDAKDIGVDTVVVAKEQKEEEEVVPSDPTPVSPPSAPLRSPCPPPSKGGKRKVQRTYQAVGHGKRSDDEEKEMEIDEFYKRSPSPPALPAQPQLPSKAVRRKVKRNSHQDVGHGKRISEEKNVVEIKHVYLPPPSPQPPPPPPPPPSPPMTEKKRSKDFLVSLRRKKKKQRQKSVENLGSLFDPEPSSLSFIPPPSPPPPPPPPPPPHFFQNLFSSKKGQSKNVHSVSSPPPPPPPPPTTLTELYVSKSVQRPLEHASVSRTKAERALATPHKPSKPVKTTSFSSVEDNVERGNASPLIPIPPPPPPPPFKMPAWKFEVRGDYVRIASFNSSRSGSPDLDSEDPSDRESSPMAGGNSGPESPAAAALSLFCPSPDVNTKADNFIARFRAGLRLEKMNSGKGKSNLGPDTSPGEGPS